MKKLRHDAADRKKGMSIGELRAIVLDPLVEQAAEATEPTSVRATVGLRGQIQDLTITWE